MSDQYVAKYIARSTAIASRMLGGEMMIMSAADSTVLYAESGRHCDLSGGRRGDSLV